VSRLLAVLIAGIVLAPSAGQAARCQLASSSWTDRGIDALLPTANVARESGMNVSPGVILGQQRAW
jgi:hypothetical protein